MSSDYGGLVARAFVVGIGAGAWLFFTILVVLHGAHVPLRLLCP